MQPQSNSRHLHAIPPYVRGPNYEYLLTEEQRERGLGYLGSRKRLKAVVAKLLRGEQQRCSRALPAAQEMSAEGQHRHVVTQAGG